MNTDFYQGKLVADNPLQDLHSRVELIGFTTLLDNSKYNVDQMPLLAARISTLREGKTGENLDNDLKLMYQTLAQNKHLTPFEHTGATFRIIMPLAMRSEWHRHRTQSYNEMSMRYLKGEEAANAVKRFYIPDVFRRQSTKNKQGSEGGFTHEENKYFRETMRDHFEIGANLYDEYVKKGVATEQARGFNPVFQYTAFYATANIRNWYQFYELRADEDAQFEIRIYAHTIGRILSQWFPETWGALSKWKNVGLSNEEIDGIIALVKASSTDGTRYLTAAGASLLAKLEKLRRRP